MNFYKYQRSRSFTDLCPGCLRFNIFNFSSKTAGLIETKFHVEPVWDEELKVCAWNLGHMTKMATMPFYGKNPLKIFFPGLKGWWPWNLVCSFWDSGPAKFIQMMTLVWLRPVLSQGHLCLNSGFFWSCCSLWHQNWLMQLAKWTFTNTRGQGHLLTLVLGSSE